MRTGESKGKWWSGEFRIGAALLSLYALALHLADPEWAMWAGAMSVGSLLAEAPQVLPFPSAELFAGAGVLGVAGAVAFAAFLFTGEKTWGRSAPCGSGRENGGSVGPHAGGRGKPGTTFPPVKPLTACRFAAR